MNRNHHGEIRITGKVPRSTVSKIREILRSNPGTTLRGSFGSDGKSHYALVPSASEKPSRRRQKLRVLRARAYVGGLNLAADRIQDRERQLASLKARAARSRRLLGV